MVVKTYRGLLADGVQEKIPLSTKDGSVGYRIVKFEILPTTPGDVDQESCCKLWKTFQSSIDDNIDFTDSDLLAAGMYAASSSSAYQYTPPVIIFDNEIFNQDIYVTHKDTQSGSLNYYLELEQMKLDHTQNMSATLKAIRGAAVD